MDNERAQKMSSQGYASIEALYYVDRENKVTCKCQVEVFIEPGNRKIEIMGPVGGRPDCKRTIEKTIQAALFNSGFIFPDVETSVNVIYDDPIQGLIDARNPYVHERLPGKQLSSAIALGLLAATGQCDLLKDRSIWTSEMSFSGDLRTGECATLAELVRECDLLAKEEPAPSISLDEVMQSARMASKESSAFQNVQKQRPLERG